MKLETRIQIEKRIARKVVRALLAAGYAISVDNGDDEPAVRRATDFSQIAKVLRQTDDEHLLVYRNGEACGSALAVYEAYGWVHLVYGNDGYDVVADYTINLEPVLAPINQYADQLSEQYA